MSRYSPQVSQLTVCMSHFALPGIGPDMPGIGQVWYHLILANIAGIIQALVETVLSARKDHFVFLPTCNVAIDSPPDDYSMFLCVRLPWTSQTHGDNNATTTFLISLCRPLSVNYTSCSTNTSVCMINDGSSISAGNFSTDIEAVQDSSTGEIRLTLLGGECDSANPTSLWKTFIVFKCSKTLVSTFHTSGSARPTTICFGVFSHIFTHLK